MPLSSPCSLCSKPDPFNPEAAEITASSKTFSRYSVLNPDIQKRLIDLRVSVVGLYRSGLRGLSRDRWHGVLGPSMDESETADSAHGNQIARWRAGLMVWMLPGCYGPTTAATSALCPPPSLSAERLNRD